MNFKFENIKKGPVSTAIGVVLILVSLYLMIWTETTVGESLMVLAAGAAFMGLRSNHIDGTGKGKTATMVITLILILFYMASCATFDRCAQKYGTGKTHTVRDTVRMKEPVPVPGDSVLARLQIDSLLAAKPGDTIYLKSKTGRAEIAFWKDRYNNYVNAQANCPKDTVWLEKEVPVEVECPDTLILDPEREELSMWEKFWEGFKEVAGYVVLAGIGLVVLRLIIK